MGFSIFHYQVPCRKISKIVCLEQNIASHIWVMYYTDNYFVLTQNLCNTWHHFWNQQFSLWTNSANFHVFLGSIVFRINLCWNYSICYHLTSVYSSSKWINFYSYFHIWFYFATIYVILSVFTSKWTVLLHSLFFCQQY